MSVIWDLVRETNARGENANSRLVGEAGPEASERRRSPRTSLYVPVFVYGYSATDEPFHEETNTLQVNANGGLLRLCANVHFGQKLLLMNRLTKQEQECYVVTVGNRPRHADRHVGVALSKCAPEFWGLHR